MKTFLTSIAIAAVYLTTAAHASTVTVTGATEIAKPAAVTNAAPGSDAGTQWFLESSGSIVAADAAGLGGTGITAGQRVDTYMIFLNRETGSSLLEDRSSFLFSTAILGVFSQANGADLVATDYFGGTTTYTNFPARGIENGNNGSLSAGPGDDLLSIIGTSQLDLFLRVTQPGDWVRVATVSAVPIPASALLLPLGLGALGFASRRKRKAVAA